MSEVIIKTDNNTVAEAAAEIVVAQLNRAINEHGNAVWVMAGGTSPMAAYKILARDYADQVDWSKVQVLIGDERCVPLDDPDSNWYQIEPIFLNVISMPAANKLRPHTDLSAQAAAQQYEAMLKQALQVGGELLRFDVVWLGVGEDGHTLSLFPGQTTLQVTDRLVVPVHESPKPPSTRISLTLKALQATENCLIMCAGAGKAGVISEVIQKENDLPIAQAARTIETHKGHVCWLLDEAAASKM